MSTILLIEYFNETIASKNAEIERLKHELKLSQAGWRKGDADDFLGAGQNTNNALEIKE
jgi:hypothetical protein